MLSMLSLPNIDSSNVAYQQNFNINLHMGAEVLILTTLDFCVIKTDFTMCCTDVNDETR